MPKRMPAAGSIVCATDLTDAGDEALRQASEAARAGKARLVVLHVLPEPVAPHPIQALARKPHSAQLPHASAQAVDRVNAQLERVGENRSAVDVQVEHGVPHAVIIERAEALRARLIVVGASRAHVGHEAERVVRYAHCPVLVARPGPREGTVLAATDLSDAALPAVSAAVAYARRYRAPLAVLHVVDLNVLMIQPDIGSGVSIPLTPELRESLMFAARQRLNKALRSHRVTGTQIVESGSPASVILDQADQVTARLVVLGTAGATGLKRMLLGSVAEAVVRHAPCSTLVVRLYAGGKTARRR